MSRNTNKYAMMVEWHLFREKEIKQAVADAALEASEALSDAVKKINTDLGGKIRDSITSCS